MAASTGQPPSLPYRPLGRFGHVSTIIEGRQYMWHGSYGALSGPPPSVVEVFEDVLPNWQQKATSGQPPPESVYAACTSIGIHIYVFGGLDTKTAYNTIHRLDTKRLVWRELPTSNPSEAPMAKWCARMVSLTTNILVIVGGYGILPDHRHPNRQYTPYPVYEGMGWTNELHCFHVVSSEL